MKPFKPFDNRLQSLDVDPVFADTALRYGPNKLRFFENPEMSGGGRPGMTEARRDIAGSHFAAAKMDRHQDLASRGMVKRVQHRIQLGDSLVRVWLVVVAQPAAWQQLVPRALAVR